jgi:uncharacterized membrane protein
MMLTLSNKKIVFWVAIWEIAFFLLSASGYNHLQLLNIIGFLTLILLPGMLTVILFRLENLPLWGYISLTVAFSILELMVMALIGNTILPHFGNFTPLDKRTLLVEFAFLVNILLLFVARYEKEIRMSVYPFILFKTKRDTFFALLPILFLALSVFGAFRLNNGASDILTIVMLAGMGLYIGVMIYFSEEFSDNVIPTAIFLMSLSLLLMTSLRGWFITGHDIQVEYKVFQLAASKNIWNIKTYQDPYNACLSITILPTVFFNLLKLPGQYVYKLLFQIIFALAPVLVYLIGRRWTTAKIAFIGTAYFIAFPTFFTDMPFLNRQEIAFVFYGLMLYLIFEEKLSLTMRRILFVIMGIGVILSHYSTTYIVLIIFGVTILSFNLFEKIFSYMHSKKIFKDSALPLLHDHALKNKKITYTMVIILFVLSFFWTSLITHTSNNVSDVVTQTIAAVENGFGGANRSSDATSLLSFTKRDPNQEMQEYIKTVIDPIRAAVPANDANEYYPASIYSQYPIVGLPDEILPFTKIGLFANKVFHVKVTSLVELFGQIFAKLSEVLIGIGIVYLLFKKNIIKRIDSEIIIMTIVSLIFVALNIVLPVLSTQYGIFRAMQQSLFIIGPLLVIGSIAIGRILMKFIKPLRKNVAKTDTIFATIFIIVFFAYSTALIPQIFGGNAALLHLNNEGTYYDDFYTHAQEVYAINWIADLNPTIEDQIQFDVQSDRFSSSKVLSISNLSPSNDILPSIIKRQAFIFLSYANVVNHRATELFSGDRISYSYPINFLNDNKDLLYNNGGSRIYR